MPKPERNVDGKRNKKSRVGPKPRAARGNDGGTPGEPAFLDGVAAFTELTRLVDACLPTGLRCRMVRPCADGSAYIDLRTDGNREAALIWSLTGSGPDSHPLGLVRPHPNSVRIPKTRMMDATRRVQSILDGMADDPQWLWLRPAGPEAGDLRRRVLASPLGRGFSWRSYRLKAADPLCDRSIRLILDGPSGDLAFALRDPVDGRETKSEQVAGGPCFGLWIVQDHRPPELRSILAQQPERLVGFMVRRALNGLSSREAPALPRTQARGEIGMYLFLNRNVCDLDCIFCSRGRPEWKRRVVEESRGHDYQAELVTLARAIREFPDKRRFHLGGHEPALYPTLLPLMEEARRAKFEEIVVETNGVALADPGLCARLKAAGLNEARLPIYGLSQEVHDSITGIKGSRIALMKAVDNLKALGVRVLLKTVLMRQNMEEMQALEAAYPRISCSMVMPSSDDPEEYIRVCPRLSDVPAAVLEMVKDVHLPCLWPDYRHTEVRQAAPGRGFLLGDGGRLVNQHRDGTLSAEQLRQLKVHPACCKDCRKRQECTGMYAMYFEVYGHGELRPF